MTITNLHTAMFGGAWGALHFAYRYDGAPADAAHEPAFRNSTGPPDHGALSELERRAQAAAIRRLAEERLPLYEYAYAVAALSRDQGQRERAIEQVTVWLRGEVQDEQASGAGIVVRQYVGGGSSIRKLRRAMKAGQGRAIEFQRQGFDKLDQLRTRMLAIMDEALRGRGLLYERE